MSMNKNKLAEILDKHIKWLNDEDGGERADLRGANLSGANLSGANLRAADLRGADLYLADLCGANLRYANLRGVNLCEADLNDTDLLGADLSGADLRDALGINDAPIACPDTGAFVGWKKCRMYENVAELLIVKLLIPEDAKRSSATGRKCRASKAIVLDVQDTDGNPIDKPAYSTHLGSTSFEYRKGETVVPEKPFDNNRWKECASGIHFFITRQEAVDYQW